MPDLTSESHPLTVDWLPGHAVGLTMAPGKFQRSPRGHTWNRDLDTDLHRLRAVERADVLVCLLEPHELRALAVHGLVTRAREHGLVVLRFPIRDAHVPPSRAKLARLIERIERHADAGRRVVIHCAAGLGRSGLVAGCYLKQRGAKADEALRVLAATRGPRCPETKEQIAFVRGWRRRVRRTTSCCKPGTGSAGSAAPPASRGRREALDRRRDPPPPSPSPHPLDQAT